MAGSPPPSLASKLAACDAQFREDVAAQLRAIGNVAAGAGLAVEVTVDPRHAVLELRQGNHDHTSLRIVAAFNEDRAAQPGWSDWLELRIETADWSRALLTLAWLEQAGGDMAAQLARYEQRTAVTVPASLRGLNTEADIRAGPYARGDVLQQLQSELQRAIANAGFQVQPSRALMAMPPTEITPVRTKQAAPILTPRDANFDEITPLAPAGHTSAVIGMAIEALPDEALNQALAAFHDYLRKHASGGGLTTGDVAAFVQEGMTELQSYLCSHLEGRSTMTGALAGLKGMALIGALATAYGAEVMTSGFAFGDMIRADSLNWPLAFTSSFLFGGGLIALAETDKQRQFWGRVGLAWALSVSVLSASNPSLVNPMQDRLGVVLESSAAARNRAELAKARFEDLEKKLTARSAAVARDTESYTKARRNRPAALSASRNAESATEASRDAARDAALRAGQEWAAAQKSDPSRYMAMALVFVLSATITGAGQWFIGNYLGTRLGQHQEAVKRDRARRRMRHNARNLTRRKGQESRARQILATMRATYMTQLERSGRFSAAKIKTMTEKAFGKTAEDAQAIVDRAVDGYRQSVRPAWRAWVWRGNSGRSPGAKG
jgi:RNase P protein component